MKKGTKKYTIRPNQQIVIELIDKALQEQAKQVILDGLKERWGLLNDSLNSDLNNIVGTYIKQGNSFLVGKLRDIIVCTGALTYEDVNIGRIVRMYVVKRFRKKGLGTLMLQHLVKIAKEKKYQKLVLETSIGWLDAIAFYKKFGFEVYNITDHDIHFSMALDSFE
jgi:GNAT superfamily N-acetyltransferase